MSTWSRAAEVFSTTSDLSRGRAFQSVIIFTSVNHLGHGRTNKDKKHDALPQRPNDKTDKIATNVAGSMYLDVKIARAPRAARLICKILCLHQIVEEGPIMSMAKGVPQLSTWNIGTKGSTTFHRNTNGLAAVWVLACPLAASYPRRQSWSAPTIISVCLTTALTYNHIYAFCQMSRALMLQMLPRRRQKSGSMAVGDTLGLASGSCYAA